jgi:thiosulfate/3-mercaptopyruvate sulfurtransferase
MSALISAAELKALPQAKILDASWNLPPSGEAIPGARNFSIDDIADPLSPFAHTIPTEEVFAAKVRELGIGSQDFVVVYDRNGVSLAAARAWWMFRLFGHDNVKVLNGGLPAWKKAGYATQPKPTDIPAPGLFKAKLHPELLRTVGQITDNLLRKSLTVLDARDTKRFGEGHIPESVNVPYTTLIDADGALKPAEELAKQFKVDTQKKLACSCGSGVTACVIALALYELGNHSAAVYDGSWTEWGSISTLPKMTGTL